MQRGSRPRQRRRGLLFRWFSIGLAVIAGSPLSDGQTGTGETPARAPFERPAITDPPASSRLGSPTSESDLDRFREADSIATDGEVVPAETPGLRRAGERSWRRSGSSGQGSRSPSVLGTLGWLALVIGIAVATLYAVRRFLPNSIVPQNRQLVRVVGRTALGPKSQLVVAQVGGQLLILGVTGESITRLGEIEDPEEATRFSPPEESFAGRFAAVEDVYPESDSVEPQAPVPEARLEPYRREVARLKSMVDQWTRPDERGSA